MNLRPPVRSALFMPASNARAIAKARGLPCDCVILDLEDAVAEERKVEARGAAVAAIAAGGFGQKLVVIRVNGADTAWGADDLAAVAEAGADAILLPKVEAVATLVEAKAALGGSRARPVQPQLWAMIETPGGILGTEALAATGVLDAFVIGPNDLRLGLGLPTGGGKEVLNTCLALALVAARAHGLLILDGVYNDFADQAGFEAACRAARDMGFDGKSLIHPSQIEPANRIFAPDEAALAEARAIVAAFAAPEAAGKGAIPLNGRMVERLHLAAARRFLRLDEV